MAIKLTGLNAALSTFREVDRRYKAAAAAELERGAKAIAKLARDYAPIKKGLLVRSIRAQRVASTHATIWKVSVGGNVEYATHVHERFTLTAGEQTRVPSSWADPRNPGKKSQAKAASLGVLVGGKFLSRALNKLAPEIQQRIRQALAGETNKLNKITRRKK